MISLKMAPRFLVAARALRMVSFLVPIAVLFYADKGVSLGDFFLIQGIWAISVFAFEIPTGYIGDLFSRKKVIAFSFLLCVLANLLMGFGYGFWALLSGELLLGLSAALYSGTAEAYYHDILKRREREDVFHKKLAKIESVSMLSLAISTLSAGFLYAWFGASFCAFITAFMAFIGFVLICLLPEIKDSKRVVEQGVSKIKDILNISKFAVKHPEIKWLMLFPACYGALTFILMWGLQPVMMDKGVPVYLFGFVMGFNMFCRTGWAHYSAKLLDRFKLRRTTRILFWVLCVGIAAAVISVSVPAGLTYVFLGLMAVASGSQIAVEIITSSFVHKRIASDERSTVLSVKSMVSMLMSGLVMISMKPLLDNFGVQWTFIISALLLGLIFVSMKKLLKLHIKE